MNKKKVFFASIAALISIGAVSLAPKMIHSLVGTSVLSPPIKMQNAASDARFVFPSEAQTDPDPEAIARIFIKKAIKKPLPSQKKVPAMDPKTLPVEETPIIQLEEPVVTTTTIKEEPIQTVPETSTTTLITIVPPIPMPIVKAPWLRMVGKITDQENVTRVFFRNEKTGGIIKVRDDGVPENGIRMDPSNQTSFFIEMDSVVYECTKR